MPHISVKCYPGRTEEQKIMLAKKITEDVKEIMEAKEETISITIEDVQPQDWDTTVKNVEILPKASVMYKKPHYME
ncbi:MAG: tautomerase family protein [Lachnospiraceae bacterium]|nr:tautomerase family protein [Lachnospiraceae bacterium]